MDPSVSSLEKKAEGRGELARPNVRLAHGKLVGRRSAERYIEEEAQRARKRWVPRWRFICGGF